MRPSGPWIVALGGHELNAGLSAVADRRGARLLVVDWNEVPSVSGDRHLTLDIKDSGWVVDAVKLVVERLLFAYTSSDAGTETAAQIHAAYGLRRPPRRGLATARNKLAMNYAWRRRGLLTKRFGACRSLGELCEFHRRVGDVIVKPVSGSSSRGVTFVGANDDDGVLGWATQRARAVDPAGPVMIEEYVYGTEFTVEMICDSAGRVQVLGISRKHQSINAGRSRVATKLHYNPPEVPTHVQLRIADFAQHCFRAIGLDTCLGHFELIMRPDGSLVPLELGARSSGFVATHLVDAAIGEPGMLLDTYERVARGAHVTNERLKPRRSSMCFFYDFPNGVGRRSGTSLMDFTPAGIESLACNRSKLVRGEAFGPIDNESERHGYEILSGDSEILTIGAVEAAEAAHRRQFLDENDADSSIGRAAELACT